MPEAIANGLPIAVEGSSKQAFWGDCNQEGLCNSSKQLIGIPCNKYAQLKADSNDAIIDRQLKAKNAKALGNNTARAAFNHLRTSDGDCADPVPFRCYIKAPDLINAFTDGSWLNPKKRFLAFGGAGVHWPGRAIKKEDLGDT